MGNDMTFTKNWLQPSLNPLQTIGNTFSSYHRLENDNWTPLGISEIELKRFINYFCFKNNSNPFPKDIELLIFKKLYPICIIPPILIWFEDFFDQDIERYKTLGIYRMSVSTTKYQTIVENYLWKCKKLPPVKDFTCKFSKLTNLNYVIAGAVKQWFR